MFERLKILLLSSGIARLLCIILFFGLLSVAAAVFSGFNKKPPELTAIVPAVSSVGEVVSIEGSGFGDERGDGWVEISGTRVSSSAYVSWSDSCIKIVVPENYSDGLLRVHSRSGKSNVLVLSKKENIPQEATVSAITSPVIHSINPSQGNIGGVLAIYGANFGITRENSVVLFTKMQEAGTRSYSDRETASRPLIVQDDSTFGYDFWSDQEIRVRIPDGAASGPVYVQTGRGMSAPADLRITGMPGTKLFANQRVYLISMDMEITNVEAANGSQILIRVPRPLASAAQQNVRVQESEPAPYIEDYLGTILHQFENIRNGNRIAIHHTFTLTNCDILTDIDARQVGQYDSSSSLHRAYTAPDSLVPSDADEIAEALASVPDGGNSNPYRRARAIYNWLLENIQYAAVSNRGRSPLEALNAGSGDAYDMAILFCAMARASGIPAVPIAGIVVDPDQRSIPHWWAEFYIENFGWVPVDIGMAAGIPYQADRGDAESADWYFGNIDGNRVAFSRGLNYQTPMSAGGKIVGYPRSFSFQRIWEESNESIAGYTSFWNTPQAAGVY